MCSTTKVVALFGRVLADFGLEPSEQRVLDLGAGSGVGGGGLRALGVGHVVALDPEPAARQAALRDHPGTYDGYVVGSLDAPTSELAILREACLTAVVALAAIGIGHVEPPALQRALDLLEPGGLFAFAITPALMPDSEDAVGLATGFPELIATLLEWTEGLHEHRYIHRRRTDGSADDAVALAGRLSGS